MLLQQLHELFDRKLEDVQRQQRRASVVEREGPPIILVDIDTKEVMIPRAHELAAQHRRRAEQRHDADDEVGHEQQQEDHLNHSHLLRIRCPSAWRKNLLQLRSTML